MHSTDTATACEISADQRLVLQAIYDAFARRTAWPTFGQIDRVLRRQLFGADPAAVVASVPAALLLPVSGGRREPIEEDELVLTVLGMSLCTGAEQDVERFLAATRWMARIEDDFDPGDNPLAKPTVTSAALADALTLTGGDVEFVSRMYLMLKAQRWGMGSGGGNPDDWWYELTREIRRFAAVTTAADYAQARTDWLRDMTPPPLAIGTGPPPETGDLQGGDVARMTVNHQAIARMMAEIQASFNRHPIRVPIEADPSGLAPGPTTVINGPVIYGGAHGAQLAWNNHTAVQQRDAADPEQIVAGFEAIAQTVVSIMEGLPAAGLDPADAQDTNDAATEILTEVTAADPDRGRIRRAAHSLKGLLAPLAIRAATGTGEGVEEWAKTGIEQLSHHVHF